MQEKYQEWTKKAMKTYNLTWKNEKVLSKGAETE